jgi:hypothetical protein
MTTSEAIVTSSREFASLQNLLAVATERFNQATQEKEGLLAFIGTLEIITSEDRNEFLEQITAEQDAYEAIRQLHHKIIGLLREKPQAKAATNHRRRKAPPPPRLTSRRTIAGRTTWMSQGS